MILYHSIACDTECDPPRYVTRERWWRGRLVHSEPVRLDGCPIGDPTLPGGVLAADDVAVIPDE